MQEKFEKTLPRDSGRHLTETSLANLVRCWKRIILEPRLHGIPDVRCPGPVVLVDISKYGFRGGITLQLAFRLILSNSIDDSVMSSNCLSGLRPAAEICRNWDGGNIAQVRENGIRTLNTFLRTVAC